ncbi:uncharacterized protein TRAVEDRAFT_24687 [Trametes versicolor FP-101664 SS1]|uniref:Uncharacterized protein n=1 Tax=Trametes versicolor (strain FP-101664) TaxID=717944 RepID=R7SAF1_TRAVS|nr:uncharacterized protein TRAVEDRAFT_24687 [Trametes versicolor FP-101664 SS1]EIW51944.1 hypothetical protein TRAVEDRAFT_24687 [Trametes versicolor FP-101664 SS1]
MATPPVKALAAIGCYHSPLDVTYSETSRDISLATTLTLTVGDAGDSFEDDPEDDFDSETEFSQEEVSSAFQQAIQLSISLSSYTPSTRKRPPSLTVKKQPPEDDTKARFSVINFIHIHDDQPPSSNLYDSESTNLKDIASMPRFEAPCVDGSDGTRTYTFNTGGTLQRIVAQADFIVPASLDREHDHFKVRLLRLALELPHPGARSDNDVWLSIDLSDIFERETDNAGPSSAILPADGSSRPSGATDPVLCTSPEPLETSESIIIPGFEPARSSELPAPPQPSQKRPRQASSRRASLGSEYAKRICLSGPQTDDFATDSSSAGGCSTESFSEVPPLTHSQGLSNSNLTGTASFESAVSHGMYGHGRFATTDRTWSEYNGEGVEIISSDVPTSVAVRDGDGAIDSRMIPEVPGFAWELPQWLYSISERSDTHERAESVWPPPGYPPLPPLGYTPSESTTDLQSDRFPESIADTGASYARRESVDALRHENNALRTQIAVLSSQNTTLSTQMQDMALKMSTVLARLDTITDPAGACNFFTASPVHLIDLLHRAQNSTSAARWEVR